MIKKTFRLSEHAADCIKKIQCEKNLKTETAAIEFVLNRYCEQESLDAVLEKVIEEKIYPAIKLIMKISREEEEKTDLLLDGMNAQLVHFAIGRYISYEENPAEVFHMAKQRRKEKLAEAQVKKSYEQAKGN